MDGMTDCTGDEGLQLFGQLVVAVMDGDGPQVEHQEEAQPHHFVEGEQEDVDVVWKTLEHGIQWFQSVTGER